MDRLAGKIAAAGALTLLLSASPAFGEPGPGKGRTSSDGKEVHRLEEVKILGKADHPGVLFFLPRAKFRLLPLREEHDGTERALLEFRQTGEFPR